MKPHRVRMAHSLILHYGLYSKMDVYRPRRAEAEDMEKFHTADYISFLQNVTPDNVVGGWSSCGCADIWLPACGCKRASCGPAATGGGRGATWRCCWLAGGASAGGLRAAGDAVQPTWGCEPCLHPPPPLVTLWWLLPTKYQTRPPPTPQPPPPPHPPHPR